MARWVLSLLPATAYFTLPYIVHSAGDHPWQDESRQSYDLTCLLYLLTLFTVQITCGKDGSFTPTCLPYLMTYDNMLHSVDAHTNWPVYSDVFDFPSSRLVQLLR